MSILDDLRGVFDEEAKEIDLFGIDFILVFPDRDDFPLGNAPVSGSLEAKRLAGDWFPGDLPEQARCSFGISKPPAADQRRVLEVLAGMRDQGGGCADPVGDLLQDILQERFKLGSVGTKPAHPRDQLLQVVDLVPVVDTLAGDLSNFLGGEGLAVKPDIQARFFDDLVDAVVAIRGDEDDLGGTVDRSDALGGFQAIPAWHSHIEEDHGEGAARVDGGADFIESLHPAGGLGQLDVEADSARSRPVGGQARLGFIVVEEGRGSRVEPAGVPPLGEQNLADAIADHFVVVNDQHSRVQRGLHVRALVSGYRVRSKWTTRRVLGHRFA